jgi:hypothetical protein
LNKRFFAFIILLYIISFYVFSQELEELQTETERNDSSILFINSYIINVDGNTRTYVIEDICKLKTGEKIKGSYGIEKYIRDKIQLLENERFFEDIRIEYSVGPQENGEYPVDLEINVKDSSNIIAYPQPEYSSDKGYDFRFKIRDFNFLGTLQPLKIDLGYIYDQFQRRYFLFIVDTNTSFKMFDLKWYLNFKNEIQYRPDLEKVFYYGNTTGLSVNLPVKFTTLIIGLNESFYANLENEDKYKPLYGDTQEGFFISSNPYVVWEIPTGIEAGNLGELYYTPYISFIHNLEFSGWSLDDIRKYPELYFGHSAGIFNVNWINNFRKGTESFISNGYEYSFRNKKYNLRALDINVAFTSINHFIIKNDLFGISSRLKFRHWFYSYIYEEAGDVLRGVDDDELFTNSMISLNLDFPLKVLMFRPSEWFNNEKLKIFDFDLHLAPIIDIAVFNYPDNQIGNMNNILITGGLEALFFPRKYRAFNMRASFGYNFSGVINKNHIPALSSKYEIYVGTDFFY